MGGVGAKFQVCQDGDFRYQMQRPILAVVSYFLLAVVLYFLFVVVAWQSLDASLPLVKILYRHEPTFFWAEIFVCFWDKMFLYFALSFEISILKLAFEISIWKKLNLMLSCLPPVTSDSSVDIKRVQVFNASMQQCIVKLCENIQKWCFWSFGQDIDVFLFHQKIRKICIFL